MKRPLAHIGFSVGITLLILNLIGIDYLLVIMAGLVVLFATSLVLSKYRKALSIPLCLGGIILGCLIFLCTYTSSVEPALNLDDKTGIAEGYIVDLEQKGETYYTYTLKTRSIEIDGAPQSIKLKLRSKEKIEADSYQIIRTKLKFNKLSDNAFDSYGYWGDNVYLSAKLYQYEALNEHINSPNKFILKLRQNIIDTITNDVKADSGGLTCALLIGDKSHLSRNAYNDFKMSGVTHIMAVSGMHLVVLSSVFIFILKKLGCNQQLRSVIIIPLILVYVALAGFSKSVVRAGIIMIVLLIGELFKRKSDSLNSLGLAVLILCFNPFAVCDVGCVLSVLSTLSLITLLPYINERIMRIKILNKPILKSITQSLAITLCVMLYTIPVMYVYFGYVSIASLLSNIILVPIGSVAMVSSLLLYISHFIPFINPIFIWLSNLVCSLMLKITGLTANLPNAIIPLMDELYAVFAATLVIAGIAFMTNRKQNIKLAVGFCFVALFLSLLTPFVYKDKSDKLLVFSNNAIIVQKDNKALVSNLRDYDDYVDIYNYLFSNSVKLDTIVLADDYEDNKYNIALSQRLKPSNILYACKDETLYELPNVNMIEVNSYYEFSDNVVYEALDDSNYHFIVKVNDFTISNSAFVDSDIKISKKYIQDCNGYIDLSYSNVVYCLNSDETFTVRRAD